MLMTILSGLLGIAASSLDNWQKRKTAEAEATVAIAKARAEAEVTRLQKAQDAEIAWDQSAVEQMERSWKDEWFTLLLSIPAIIAFIKPEIVLVGFQALEVMPLWYQTALGVAIAASFGYRKLVDAMTHWNTLKKGGKE